MCEMTSIGEISAASMTTPGGSDPLSADKEEAGASVGDLRSALTTSFTPRLSVLWPAAVIVSFDWDEDGISTSLDSFEALLCNFLIRQRLREWYKRTYWSVGQFAGLLIFTFRFVLNGVEGFLGERFSF
jgi:hypothetical protein